MKILCIGEAVRDVTLRLEKAKIISKDGQDYLSFRYGAKLEVDELFQTVGGSAANVSVGLARLGIESSLFCTLGTNLSATEIVETLRREEVDTSFIERRKEYKTKTATILSAGEGDRTILIYHGDAHLTPANLDERAIAKFDYIYLGPLPKKTEKFVLKLAEIVQQRNLKLVFNPGTVQLSWEFDLNREIVKNSQLLILNKEEATKLLKKNVREKKECDEKELIQELIALGVKQAIITLGREGSLGFDGKKMIKAGILKGRRVDATGAGDAYFSGVLSALAWGQDLKEAMKWGTINASFVVGFFGTQTGLLRRAELKNKLKQCRIEIQEI